MTSGPLRQVLDAVAAGVPTVADISRRTGLSDDVVHAAIDQLVRMGQLDAKEMSAGCPPAGCGGCASGKQTPAGPAPGCGAVGPSEARQGPVLIALTIPTRGDQPVGSGASG